MHLPHALTSEDVEYMPIGMDFTRREVLASLGLITLGMTPDPRQPETEDAFEQLSAVECATLAALGETLLPGAAEAGIVTYVKTQLASEAPLLFVRYLDYPEHLLSFYQRGLKALDELGNSRYGQPFANLSSERKHAIAREVSQRTPVDWSGPPSPLFYLAVRNDAIDVYYGTERGFEKLGLPYLALMTPPKPW